MKIYFAFTVFGDRSNIEHARKLVDILENKGHTILTKHLFSNNAFEEDSKITPEDVFMRDMNWLNEADAVIVEASGSSFGIGFETGFVLGAMNKPVYLIYDRSLEKKISRMITGLLHENCTKVAYNNFSELEKFFERTF